MPREDKSTPTQQKAEPPSLSDFEQQEEVAWGSLATIIDVIYKKNGKHYALKVLNKGQLAKKKAIASVHAERNALIALGKKSYHHPGVVRLHHCFHDPDHLYFVLDLATNGDLKMLVQILGSISLNCARYYTAQVVDAVQFLHESGISHRDIKPENVLLDDEMRIKLADFGCAYVGANMETPRTNTFVGTAAYISPELLARLEVNPKSPDIWAIGCTLYFFLFGSSPFMAATDYLIMKRVRALDYSIPDVCDKDAADIIRAFLVRHKFVIKVAGVNSVFSQVLDPLERLGVPPKSSSKALRQHPFFVGNEEKPTSGAGTSPALWSVVDWESLWTAPPPPIEVGPYRARPKEVPADDLWKGFESLHLVND
ncbi:hypothetical protein NLJ89_g5966 [Agrocybe chaxingu]|uniref:non-specific serine/threonine protein kinase n=1 Tax=Agrocybe chaxingu TaxID=84603 RepID=A0A9W8JZL3_9AGAR|nr:hypothetical protein NLJ89_g5966 [Agrocybe chaxingu]